MTKKILFWHFTKTDQPPSATSQTIKVLQGCQQNGMHSVTLCPMHAYIVGLLLLTDELPLHKIIHNLPATPKLSLELAVHLSTDILSQIVMISVAAYLLCLLTARQYWMYIILFNRISKLNVLIINAPFAVATGLWTLVK